MADNTKIEWADATLNYVNGCSLASPGCTNCYAMKQAHRFPVRQGLTVHTKGGMVWTGEVRENPKALEQALRWKRGRAIFWNAHGDLFHESVPDEWIDRQFAVMALTPQHRHMILTKRSDRMRRMLAAPHFRADVLDAASHLARDWKENARAVWHAETWPLPNVWLGVSVEDQQRADERIPDLLATPAAVRWLSCEPLLANLELGCIEQRGPEVLRADMIDALVGEGLIFDEDGELDRTVTVPRLDWIVAGGESGPGARPCHPEWARSLRDQCAAAGVPFFWKQWGAWGHGGRVTHWISVDGRLTPAHEALPAPTDSAVARIGKKAAGRLLDGREWNEVPAHG